MGVREATITRKTSTCQESTEGHVLLKETSNVDKTPKGIVISPQKYF